MICGKGDSRGAELLARALPVSGRGSLAALGQVLQRWWGGKLSTALDCSDSQRRRLRQQQQPGARRQPMKRFPLTAVAGPGEGKPPTWYGHRVRPGGTSCGRFPAVTGELAGDRAGENRWRLAGTAAHFQRSPINSAPEASGVRAGKVPPPPPARFFV